LKRFQPAFGYHYSWQCANFQTRFYKNLPTLADTLYVELEKYHGVIRHVEGRASYQVRIARSIYGESIS